MRQSAPLSHLAQPTGTATFDHIHILAGTTGSRQYFTGHARLLGTAGIGQQHATAGGYLLWSQARTPRDNRSEADQGGGNLADHEVIRVAERLEDRGVSRLRVALANAQCDAAGVEHRRDDLLPALRRRRTDLLTEVPRVRTGPNRPAQLYRLRDREAPVFFPRTFSPRS